MSRILLLWLFASSLLSTQAEARAPRQQLPAPTIHAVPNPTPTDVVEGGFETIDLGGQPEVAFPPSPPINGWSFLNGAGVADKNTSSLLNSSNNTQATVEGQQAAFLPGNTGGIIRREANPGRGQWRLVLTLAKSQDPGDPFVEILVNGRRVGVEAVTHDLFLRYESAPFPVRDTDPFVVIHVRKANDPATGSPSGGTALIDHLRLERILPWDVASSWRPTRLPNATDIVWIPSNTAVSVAGSCEAQGIHCEGELIAPSDLGSRIHLETKWLLVSGTPDRYDAYGARLEAGREQIPFRGAFTIELTGSSTDPQILDAGTKFLMAMRGGTIDLHGQEKQSWSTLSRSVNAGDDHFQVECSYGWLVGDEIVTAGSTFNRIPPETAPNFDPLYIPYSETFEIGLPTLLASNDWNIPLTGVPGSPGLSPVFAHAHLGRVANASTPSGVTDLTHPTNHPVGVPTELDQSAEVANLTRTSS